MASSGLEQARTIFAGIQTAFPDLKMQLASDPDFELRLDIPAQPGLLFNVHMNFQNEDELHLVVGEFWFSWFPMTKKNVVRAFESAVTGVISGRCRVVEYRRRDRFVGGDLQECSLSSWKTIAKLGCFRWRTTTKILRNDLPNRKKR